MVRPRTKRLEWVRGRDRARFSHLQNGLGEMRHPWEWAEQWPLWAHGAWRFFLQRPSLGLGWGLSLRAQGWSLDPRVVDLALLIPRQGPATARRCLVL